MLLGSEGIWKKYYATGPVQVNFGEDKRGKHKKSGCVTQQVDGGQVGCQFQSPVLPYQYGILSNNQ